MNLYSDYFAFCNSKSCHVTKHINIHQSKYLKWWILPIFFLVINTFYHQYLVSCFNTGKLCPYITIFTHFLSNVIWMTLETWRLSHCCPWSTWDNVWHIVNLDGGTFINSLKPSSSRYNQIHTPAQNTHARFKNRMILWFCKKNQRSLEHIGENYSTFIMRTLRTKCLSLTTSIDLGNHCGSLWVPGT